MTRRSLAVVSMILFAALFGFLFWSEVPDVASLSGGVLIIAGGVMAYLAERRRSAPVGNPPTTLC